MLSNAHLLTGDPSEVAAFLDISPRTLRRYKAHPDKLPDRDAKLLRMRLEGDLRALGGDAWDGFYLQAGGLFCPMWQRHIKPETIKGWFFELQELAALRAEVKSLRDLNAEVKQLRAALAARVAAEAHPVSLRLVR